MDRQHFSVKWVNWITFTGDNEHEVDHCCNQLLHINVSDVT